MTWAASIEEHFLGEALTSVGQMTAEQRICWGLHRYFARCKAQKLVDGDTCPFPYKQQDLADALGLSLVHTNKTLGKLRDRQILSWREDALHFMDSDAVAEIAMIDGEEVLLRPLI